MEIFAVEQNVFQKSVNYYWMIFFRTYGSCGIKNIITDSDILNLGGLHVDISTKNTAESTKKLYQWDKSSFK